MAAVDINKILDESRALGCSDLHFTVGIPPIVRQGGALRKLSSYPDMTEIEIQQICDDMCNDKQRQQIKDHIDTDFTFVSTRGFRHRVNVYRQRGNTAIAIRLLRNDIPTLAEKNLYPHWYGSSRAIAAPKGTPDEVIQFYEEAFRKTLTDPECVREHDKLELNIDYMDSQELTNFIKAQEKFAKKIVSGLYK